MRTVCGIIGGSRTCVYITMVMSVIKKVKT